MKNLDPALQSHLDEGTTTLAWCWRITRADGTSETIQVTLRIDTLDEVEYYKNGGILQYVLRSMMKQAA